MKVIVSRGDRWGNAFVVHLSRTIDVFPQTFVDVALVAAFADLLFVIEFDFGNQQTGESTCVVVKRTLIIANIDR